MGLKDSTKELNNYANISPLSSDTDIPLYANAPITYNRKYPYSSRSSSSLSSDTSIIKKYPSDSNSNDLISYRQNNVYANISKLSIDTIDIGIKSLILNDDYDNNNNKQFYENLKLNPSSSSIYMNLKDDKQDTIEIKQTNLETKTKQTIEKSEVNMTPNCNDKRDLYRTKIPSTVTKMFSTIRPRRGLSRPRRYRRRSSTAIRTIVNSNVMRRQQQQQQHHSNNRPQRLVKKSVSNELYNEIPVDNQSINSFYTEEIFETPTGGLEKEGILCWYPLEDALIPQVFSTSENGESVEQDEEEVEEEKKELEDEEEEEEEELLPHKTFEDFLLRRPSKSTYSSLASVTNTLLSERNSPEIPVRPSPLNRRASGMTLSLDKKDVDFIHNIIQRKNGGNQRESNRIAALREAYLRAENKRNDLLKSKTILKHNTNNKILKKPSINHSSIATKIRQELEKYDELPAHRKNSYSDDDDYDDEDEDETYTTNDNYRYRHRKLPPTPSTASRIINFVTTLKRQIQKNFHEIRSKILIEAMANSSQRRPIIHNHTLGYSHHYRPRGKTSYNFIRRTHSHQSVEHSYPFHRHQLSRTHSDISQTHSHYHRVSHRPRTFRITSHVPPRRQRMI